MTNKKILSAIFLLLATSCSFSSYAENVRITDDNAPFLYDARAEIKTPENTLATYMSKDYREAKDEFTRHDLFQKIQPVIEKRLKQASKTTHVSILVNGKLGDYDFGKHAFPSGFSSTTFIPFDHSYAVQFTNADKLEYIPVPMKSARSLSPSLQNNRRASFLISGDIVGVKEEKINWRSYKTIQVKVTQVDASLRSGAKIGVKKI